jgi:DNA excision repair protein ERCC-2
MGKRYIKALNVFVKALNDNLAIFVSSYRVQRKLLELGLKEEIEKYNREVFIEEQNMRGEESRELINRFKACINKDRKGVLIGVMGGRFAEGADFPGKQLEGVFLVGVPFEKPTVKTQFYIQYYSKIYGEEKGRYYAYILPALKRASQALGRALRSRDDYATIVLGDERYKHYLDILPDYIQKTVKIVNFEEFFKITFKNFKI